MSLLRRRFSERCADVLEWVDYRRDANFWPLFALPPLLSVTWAYGGWIGLGIVVAFALGVALFATAAMLVATLTWVTLNAVLDVVVPTMTIVRQRVQPAKVRSATIS